MCVLLFVYLLIAFKKLQNAKLNSVDNIILLMKDNELIDGVRVTEEKVRHLFDDVTDATNVEFSKFESVMSKLLDDQTRTVGTFVNMVTNLDLTEGSKFLDVLANVAGYS